MSFSAIFGDAVLGRRQYFSSALQFVDSGDLTLPSYTTRVIVFGGRNAGETLNDTVFIDPGSRWTSLLCNVYICMSLTCLGQGREPRKRYSHPDKSRQDDGGIQRTGRGLGRRLQRLGQHRILLRAVSNKAGARFLHIRGMITGESLHQHQELFFMRTLVLAHASMESPPTLSGMAANVLMMRQAAAV